MKTINKIFNIAVLVGLLVVTSCTTDDIEPTLAQDKAVEGSITAAGDLEGIIKGAYDDMTSSTYYGRDFIIHNEVRTDNTFANGASGRFLTPGSFNFIPSNNPGIWTLAYRVIAGANIIIAIDATTLDGDQAYAQHLQGQAYAIRALAHFDLLRNYGEQHVGGSQGVPYVTTFKGDDLYPVRNSVSDVKANIYQDLTTAFSMMSDSYFDSSKEFMSKQTAKALESKVAIYFGDWAIAKSAAETVIGSGQYSIIGASSYVASFGSDASPNSIFELAFSNVDNRGGNSLGFMYKGDTYGDIQVLPNVASLYEDGDVRADILGYESFAPSRLRNLGKYPELNGYDNVAVIRYEEVILNYAEALFETGGDALTQINLLTSMRGASAYTSLTKEDIINERRKELIFEGFRYDDLLRTGKGIIKTEPEQNISETINYGDYRLAMPIPQVEMDANSNMEQNIGF